MNALVYPRFLLRTQQPTTTPLAPAEDRAQLLCRILDAEEQDDLDPATRLVFVEIGEMLGGISTDFTDALAVYLAEIERRFLDEWPDTPEHRALAWQNRQAAAREFVETAERMLAPRRQMMAAE